MVHWMRKHRRSIFFVVALITIPTFVWWGGSRGSRSRRERQNEAVQMAAVAVVGGIPITRAEYQRRLFAEADQRARYGGERPTLEQLAADGTAERVLNAMIDARLFELEVSKMKVDVSREYLEERLKEDPQFKDESGRFDSARWNEWVMADPNRNWNAIYAQMREELARTILLNQVTASARVLDSELREKFIQGTSKMQIRYVVVDPKIEPTEEQIKAQYEKNPAKYQIPEKRDVDFVSISLEPPRPAIVDEIMNRIKNGEDFGELARTYSKAADAFNSGHMGWIPETGHSDNLRALFELSAGQVGEPVFWEGAYYIYKVNDEQIDETTNERSVKASEIMIPAPLDPAERTARLEKAAAISAKARQTKDLKSAAAEAGVPVLTATAISVETEGIADIPEPDMMPFKRSIMEIAQGEVSNVIEGTHNFYVAQVTQVTPAVIQPLEAVRDKVVEDAIGAIRYSPDRRKEMEELGKKIAAEAKSLQEVVEKFPEYNLEIKESTEFSGGSLLIDQGIYLHAREIYETVGKKGPGAFAGPLQSMRGEIYFVELVKITPPTDEQWANEWPKQEEQYRKQELQAKRNRLAQDYIAYLRERAERENLIQKDMGVVAEMLAPTPEEGTDLTETPDAGGVPAETAAPESTSTPTAPDAAAPAPSEAANP